MDRQTSPAIFLACGLLAGIGATLAAQKMLTPPPPEPPFYIADDDLTPAQLRTRQRRRRRSSTSLLSFLPFGEEDAPPAPEEIRGGLEECVGHTPLILLKSLSALTGCEVLGKAEVRRPRG